MNDKTRLQEYLKANIPISSSMGIAVEFAEQDKVVLLAPLSANRNHKHTVFGGSLHSVATLACWGLLYVNLVKATEQNIQIVIAESRMNYLLPVTSDFRAECMRVEGAEWQKFIKIFEKKGKGRIELSAKIYEKGELCVDFVGSFAAIQTLR